ncbi:hypothetical protein HPB47_026095, partial [Ixodes persulcatus]
PSTSERLHAFLETKACQISLPLPEDPHKRWEVSIRAVTRLPHSVPDRLLSSRPLALTPIQEQQPSFIRWQDRDIAGFLESSGRPRVPGWQRWILHKGSSGGMLISSGHEFPRQRACLRQVLHLLRVRVQRMTKGPPHR